MLRASAIRKVLMSVLLAGVGIAGVSTGVSAAPVTFFGEDTNGGSIASSHPNADAARANFFGNLQGVGTETFESFSSNASLPLTVSFGSAGSAALSGTGYIQQGPSSSDQFPISGSKFLDTDGSFNISFSSPIAAFGFYGTDLGDVGAQLTLTLTGSNGVTSLLVPNQVSAAANGSALYYGFYDLSNTYTSISFTGAGSDVFGFDDFSVGSLQQVVPTVPLPSSLPMFGAAIVVLGAAGYRMKRKGTASL